MHPAGRSKHRNLTKRQRVDNDSADDDCWPGVHRDESPIAGVLRVGPPPLPRQHARLRNPLSIDLRRCIDHLTPAPWRRDALRQRPALSGLPASVTTAWSATVWLATVSASGAEHLAAGRCCEREGAWCALCAGSMDGIHDDGTRDRAGRCACTAGDGGERRVSRRSRTRIG